MNRRIMITAAAVPALAALAGCGSYAAAHFYNAPTPQTVLHTTPWQRLETPGNFPSVVFACFGPDGVYMAMDSYSSAEVVPDDPNCAKR